MTVLIHAFSCTCLHGCSDICHQSCSLPPEEPPLVSGTLADHAGHIVGERARELVRADHEGGDLEKVPRKM